MEIRICGYLAASHLLENEPSQWDSLIILDSGIEATDFVEKHSQRHLFLDFDDIEEQSLEGKFVTADQVQRGLEFAKESERLVVSCRAGQSRSAAMAYLIVVQELGIKYALELIDPRRHVPNRAVISAGATVLDDSEVREAFGRWLQENDHIRLSDFYDEIEREFDRLVELGAQNRIYAG